MRINIKRLNDKAVIPTRAHETDAGVDLYAAIDKPIEITPHSTVKIGTGIAVELPEGTFGAIVARSGLATKKGLRPANCIGICDQQYRGEYIVALHNDSELTQSVEPGERIAQLIVIPYLKVDFDEVQELNETERGDSGFGDSGRF